MHTLLVPPNVDGQASTGMAHINYQRQQGGLFTGSNITTADIKSENLHIPISVLSPGLKNPPSVGPPDKKKGLRG